MSKKWSLRRVLAQAKEKEKKYDWFRAAKSYDKAHTRVLKQKDFLKAGEIQERIGFCFYRAAMQAENQEEFRDRMRHAVEAYDKAHGFYEKLLKKQRDARKLRCDAVAKYIGHWLTSDPSEKRKLLDDCLELEGKTLASFLESGDMLEYGRTYNELSLVFLCRVFLERDRQTLKSILKKGLEWGEKAIAEFPEHYDLYEEIAGTYFTLATCLSDAGFYLVAESEKIDTYRVEAVKYLNKAVELSEKANNAFLLGLSHLWLGINSGEEEAARHHEKTLEYGKRTRDNFLIANGLDWLAYDTYWQARATEDPEKRRELAEKAMQLYDKAHNHYCILSFMSPRGGLIGPPSGQAEHYHQLALWEPDPKKRLEFLEKSENLGMEALKLAENTGMPMVIAQVLHVVSKTLQAQAQIEPNLPEKRSRLEKALKYRERTVEIFGQLTPFFYWNLGVMQNYLAGIKAELADIEPNLENKTRLLEEAMLSKKECVKLCNRVMPDFERKGETTLFAALRDYQDTYAALLTRLYELTDKSEHLRKAIEVLEEAIKSASKLDMVSLIAESYWKVAKAQDIMGGHLEAAKNFELASESYIKAAEKLPQLKGFYQDHAFYMQSWNEIEKAKYHHAKKQYGQAKEHYEKAANLHKSTERWNYLSQNYLAWARLEEAEDLSRGEKTREAIQLFQKAAKLFREANNTLQVAVRKIQNANEKDLAKRLIKALGIREEYCLGRIALEEAKILGRQGDNAVSSGKYGLAAKRFQEALNTIKHESNFTNATITKDRQELMPIIYLCKAWQMMKKAEVEASPELYLEASQLFDKAKEHSINEKAKLLALGHSRFCKALAAGTRFEDSRDTTLYLSATQHLESAANYYVKAGFKIASEYAIATQRLFDAYVYMANAKKEADPGKKARYYVIAEKVLQTSIGSYLKAKHPAKSEQVQRLLEKVREEKELAVSLSDVLHAPTITASTASFVTPTPSEETAVGLERFEHANIQAILILPMKEISVEEDFNLEIQIANVGKGTVLLDKVEGIFPRGFELVAEPSYCHFEDLHLNLRGKRLDPLKSEEIRLVLRSFDKGTFEIKPKIIYVDEAGHQMVSDLESVAIEVSKIILPHHITTGYENLNNLLFGGIPENYAVILTSPSCDERDLLVRKFLEAGAKEGHITFYVTTMEIGVKNLTEEFQSNFYLFICNPQADKIVKSLPNVFKLKGVENLTDINIALTSALRKLSASVEAPRRCCIQIVSDVLLQHKALQTRRWLTGFIPELKSKGFTILAVMDLGMHSPQEVRAVLDLFEGEINIYEKKNIRFLRIKRMAKQEYLESELPFSKR
jgi:KaiC/GvpD/RAD55 family RecA-like ATPase